MTVRILNISREVYAPGTVLLVTLSLAQTSGSQPRVILLLGAYLKVTGNLFGS